MSGAPSRIADSAARQEHAGAELKSPPESTACRPRLTNLLQIAGKRGSQFRPVPMQESNAGNRGTNPLSRSGSASRNPEPSKAAISISADARVENAGNRGTNPLCRLGSASRHRNRQKRQFRPVLMQESNAGNRGTNPLCRLESANGHRNRPKRQFRPVPKQESKTLEIAERTHYVV
jgi:hypothetical protein